MATPRPFSFDALRRVTHREARAMTALASSLDRAATITLDDRGLTSLLGHAPSATPLTATLLTRDEALAQHDGTSLCAVFAHHAAGVLALALPRPFARSLALRALASRDDAHAPLDTLSPAEEGALFAMLSHAITRAFAPSAPPVLRAVTDDVTSALDALGPARSLLSWPFEVAFGAETSRATLLADALVAARTPAPRPSLTPSALGLPLTMTLVAARAAWSARELSSLALRDVLSLDGVALTRRGLSGDVSVRVAGHLECDARLDGDTLTLSELPHPITAPMNDANERSPDDDARVTSIPVEITVEIARATSTVGAVASWRPGAVICFETPLGEAVLVRANGRPVARGELVDVEGTVGVRVTETL